MKSKSRNFPNRFPKRRLLTWHKKVGEAVAEGENLIDIETDKVVLELPAIKSGVLAKIIKADGTKVGSEEVIAQIDTEGVATVAAAPRANRHQRQHRFRLRHRLPQQVRPNRRHSLPQSRRRHAKWRMHMTSMPQACKAAEEKAW